jgi:taurine dioxygenase
VGDVIVNQLSPVMGAEIAGVDLSQPPGESVFQKIRDAFHRHLLLVFPDQRIDEAQQIAFSRRFGELQVHVLDQRRVLHRTVVIGDVPV